MDPQLLNTLITSLLAPGGVIALYIMARGRKKSEPIQQRDAELDVAKTLQDMGVAIAEGLRVDLSRVQGQAAAAEEKAAAAEAKAASAERKAAAAEALAAQSQEEARATRRENQGLWAWIHDLIDNWAARRLSETPPAAPTRREARYE